MQTFPGPAGHHVGDAHNVFNGAVASKQSFAKSVVFIVESRLPCDHHVLWIFECHHDRVRDLASIFFGEDSAAHARRRGLWQIERCLYPRNLVHHVFGNVSA